MEEACDVQMRIARLVDEGHQDRKRARDLFSYAWVMLCVRQGLMRVTREVSFGGETQLVVEETRTGNQRLVRRPRGLDADIEQLAVQAMGSMLGERNAQ
jgi:hypothetical protein